MNIGIILARGGSKRIPKKNLKLIDGVSLVEHALLQAIKSNVFDCLYLSTDEPQLLKEYKEDKRVVLHSRNAKNADDNSSSDEAICEVLERYNISEGLVAKIQVTSPLRRSWHWEDSLNQFQRQKALSLISVSPSWNPLSWNKKLGDDLDISNFFDENNPLIRSQDYVETFFLNGAIYLADINTFLEKRSFFLDTRCKAYIMDKKYSFDIDNQEDLELCEYVYKGLKEKNQL